MSILHLSILSSAHAVVAEQTTSFMECPPQQHDPLDDVSVPELFNAQCLADAFHSGFQEGVRHTEQRLHCQYKAQLKAQMKQLAEALAHSHVLADNRGRGPNYSWAWGELLTFWASLPADTMNFLLHSTDHLFDMLHDSHLIEEVSNTDVWSRFVDKISPQNLGMSAGGWTLLYCVTYFLDVSDQSKVNMINRILSKMDPMDVLIQNEKSGDWDGDHGIAFHKSTQKSLDVAKAFARHRNVSAGHFLVADKLIKSHLFNPSTSQNDVFLKFLTPLMYSLEWSDWKPRSSIDICMMLLKAFIDKFCIKLKMLRMTCKFLSKALKRDAMLPTNNSANVLLGLPKEVLTKIGQHVATLYIAHNCVGDDDDLPDDSINLDGAPGNLSVKQALSRVHADVQSYDEDGNPQEPRPCNLMDIFQMYKAGDAQAETKQLEDMLNNPMAFEELPFNY